MIYMRGQAADYDGWRQLGLAGWGWDDVLPYFLAPGGSSRRHERRCTGRAANGGSSGRASPGRFSTRCARPAAEIGIPEDRRLQQRRQRRLGLFRGQPAPRPALERGDGVSEAGRSSGRTCSLRPARRWSASCSRAGAPPACASPQHGMSREVRAQRRGHPVGGRDRLAAAPASSRASATPERLQGDRRRGRAMRCRASAKTCRTICSCAAIFGVTARARSTSTISRSLQARLMGLEYALSPARAADHGAVAARPVRQILARLRDRQYRIPRPAAVARPVRRAAARLSRRSRSASAICGRKAAARCHAASADPRAAPLIQPNYLSARRRPARGRRFASGSPAASSPRRRWRRYRAARSSSPAQTCQSDDELARAAGEIGTTIFHPVGTAKMGLAQDPLAVVDERLRVHGLGGLRVVDASVMPRITSGNTNSPTMMIAEKAAEMILADARRRLMWKADGKPFRRTGASRRRR